MLAALEGEPELPRMLLCWHGRSPEIEEASLQAGEYIAVDCQIAYWEDRPESSPPPVGPGAPCAAAAEVGELFRQVSESERVTTDASDLGVVSNAEGRRIGRVVAIEGLDGELLTWQLDPDWREHVPAAMPPLVGSASQVGSE